MSKKGSEMDHRRQEVKLVRALILLTVLALFLAIAGDARAGGTYSGVVFRDYNANGLKDAKEPGIGGITVTLFDKTNTVQGTTTTYAFVCASAGVPDASCTGAGTPALGSWSISAGGTGPYRVEFTGVPAFAFPAAHNLGVGGNATGVQFVADGGATNINFAVNDPAQYVSTTNPTLVTTQLISGSHTASTGPAVLSFPYTATGTNPSPPTTESQHQQVGATWGITYRRLTNRLYVSAYEKRMADFGPSGSGAIYEIVPGGPPDGTTFATIPGAAGGHVSFACPGACDGNGGGWDTGGSSSPVGKAGLGALVISDDETALYTVNLATKHLFSVTFTGPTVTDLGAVPHPTCTNGTDRPFGLGFHDGKLYMGGVCDASTGTLADLSAYVYEWNLAGAPSTATLVLSFPLNYDRTCADTVGYTNPPIPNCDGSGSTTAGPRARWNPWTDVITTAITVANTVGNNGGSYPMPMLTKIQFDNTDMLVAFRDRMGDMIGDNDPGPNSTNPVTPPAELYEVPSGDILRAGSCPTASVTCAGLGSHGWLLESNSQSVPTGSFGPTTGANTGSGPGTGCTPYANPAGCGRFFIGNDGLSNGVNQAYLSVGGLVQVPGFNEATLTSVDPTGNYSNGTIQLSNSNGTRTRSYLAYCTNVPVAPPCAGGTAVANTFAKANGLGDLVALMNPAPIEIGNRVWKDLNANGIQDAGEPPIAGVTVHLYAPDGTTLLATAVTDVNGNYFFSSDASRTSTASEIFGIAGLAPNTSGFSVRLDNAADYSSGPLTNLVLTAANQGIDPQINSKALTVSGFPRITLNTGGPGANDHIEDIGFHNSPTAVTLSEFKAENPTSWVPVALGAAGLLVLGSLAVIYGRRPKRE